MIPIMKVNGVIYYDGDINKMVYYFQNKSILRIVWDWIKLKFERKVIKEEISVPWKDEDIIGRW